MASAMEANMAERSPSSKAASDNRANQLNPNHPAYYRSRGVSVEKAESSVAQTGPSRGDRGGQSKPGGDAGPRSLSSGESPSSSSKSSSGKTE